MRFMYSIVIVFAKLLKFRPFAKSQGNRCQIPRRRIFMGITESSSGMLSMTRARWPPSVDVLLHTGLHHGGEHGYLRIE